MLAKEYIKHVTILVNFENTLKEYIVCGFT